jgi:glucokinase
MEWSAAYFVRRHRRYKREISKANRCQLGDIKTFEVARFPTFQEFLRTFLDDHCSGISFTDALLALAGPMA